MSIDVEFTMVGILVTVIHIEVYLSKNLRKT